MNQDKNNQDWIQNEIEMWLLDNRLGSMRLKNNPLGVFVTPSHMEEYFNDPEEPIRPVGASGADMAQMRADVLQSQVDKQPQWLNSLSPDRSSKSSVLPPVEFSISKPETSQSFERFEHIEPAIGTKNTVRTLAEQMVSPSQSGSLTRDLADLSLASVMAPQATPVVKNTFRGSEDQHGIEISRAHSEFDFDKDYRGQVQLGVVGKTVRFFMAHFIDLTLVFVSLLVSLVSGFFVFVFDSTLDIGAGLQFSRWLPVRLVSEFNLIEAALFFYLLFAVYWMFFKLFVGATIGRSIFTLDNSNDLESSVARQPVDT